MYAKTDTKTDTTARSAKRFRKPAGLLGIVGLVATIACAAQSGRQKAAPTVETLIARMKTTAAQIGWLTDDPSVQPPSLTRAGTGFIVDESGYVLTAAHVITGSEEEARSKHLSQVVFEVGMPMDSMSTPQIAFRGSFQWAPAKLVATDETHDVAILKITLPMHPSIRITGKQGEQLLAPPVTSATFDPKLPAEGATVLVSGYPLDLPTLVTQRGMIASESYSDVRSQPSDSSGRPVTSETVDTIFLDASVNPGNSGGPVYRTDSGAVIGICEAYLSSALLTNQKHAVPVAPNEYLTQNTGLAVVVPIKYAIDLLQKNGVSDFSTTPAPSAQHPKK